MCGSGDVTEADVLFVVLVDEGAGFCRERRRLLALFYTFFAQERCELGGKCHGEIVGNLSVRFCLLFDGCEEVQDLGEVLLRWLDGAVSVRQQMIDGQSLDAEPVDRDAVGCQVAATAAEFVVDGMAVVKDQVALLRRVALSVNHVDARTLRNEHDFTEIIMLVHASRHV